MRLAALLILLASPLAAQEFVEAPGPLSDDDFYRAVSCGADPGGTCRKPVLRWPEAKRGALTVSLSSTTPVMEPWQRTLYDAGLDAAVDQINGVDAGIRLVRTTAETADIEIHIVATPPGQIMENTGVQGLDGNRLALGRVALRARDSEIREALIAVSIAARRREIASVLLEEITQALGLMTDVSGPAYRRSVFSEDSNSVVRLQGQDAMALRRHYATDSDQPDEDS